jgi:hypothetical protein
VCVCVCVCVCVSVRVRAFYERMCLSVCVCVCVCVNACVFNERMCLCACMCVCVCVLRANICVSVCECVCSTSVCVCAYVCVCVWHAYRVVGYCTDLHYTMLCQLLPCRCSSYLLHKSSQTENQKQQRARPLRKAAVRYTRTEVPPSHFENMRGHVLIFGCHTKTTRSLMYLASCLPPTTATPVQAACPRTPPKHTP